MLADWVAGLSQQRKARMEIAPAGAGPALSPRTTGR